MKIYRFSFHAMGTPCELQFYSESQTKAQHIAHLVTQDIQRLEQRYSRYQDDSLLTQINSCAQRGESITVDHETATLLDYAFACHAQSDGLFDITSGILRKIWYRDRQQIPNPNEIQNILEYVGLHRINWNPPEINFTKPGMEIDFGGIVKEYAVDRSAVICQENSIDSGYVNLGGDIRIFGPRENNAPWKIGIRHPRRSNSIIKSLGLPQGALASSGDYERCFVIDQRRYGHVLNPKTGWPVNFLASVSVVSDLCIVAGSAATIAMLKEQDGPGWLHDLGLPHFWITVEGEIGGNLSIQ